MEHTDHQIGRILDTLEELGVLDNTLIYLIIGDNGASAEGTPNGTFNEMISLNGAAEFETTEFMADRIDEFGTPRGLQPLRGGLGPGHEHPIPVDQAGGLAFRRDPERDHRPLAQRFRGQGRAAQASSTTSSTSAATILQVAGLPEPTFVNGIQQMPYPRRLHGLCLRPARRGRSAGDPVLRGGLQPRHLPQGLDGGHPAQRALGLRRRAPRARRRRLGALRHHPSTGPRPTISPPSTRRSCGTSSGSG